MSPVVGLNGVGAHTRRIIGVGDGKEAVEAKDGGYQDAGLELASEPGVNENYGTYKPPREKMPIRAIFWRLGRLRLFNTGIG